MSVVTKMMTVPTKEYQCDLCKVTKLVKEEEPLLGGWATLQSQRNGMTYEIHLCQTCRGKVEEQLADARRANPSALIGKEAPVEVTVGDDDDVEDEDHYEEPQW